MKNDNYEVEVWFENREWWAVLYTRDEAGNRINQWAMQSHEDATTLLALMGRYVVDIERRAVSA